MSNQGYLNEDMGGLVWGELIRGLLLQRYKRFLADVRLNDDRIVTIHTPNTGRMLGCSQPGWPVYITYHDTPGRKLKYTWEVTESPVSLVGVNTSVPNRLVKTAINANLIPELSGYDRVRSEVKINDRSRLDLVLESDESGLCYVEIKNCTLVEKNTAYFPDAVTQRGAKHLNELAQLVQQGHRGVIFFLIQRMDAEYFRPADHIDPEYGRVLRRVLKQGVEALAYDVTITLKRIDIHRSLPVLL